MKKHLLYVLLSLFALSANADGLSCLTCSGGGAGGSVSVTSSSNDIVVNPSPGLTTFTIGSAVTYNNQGTATPYTIASSDMELVVTHNKLTAVAVTLPAPSTSGFGTKNSFTDWNLGAGTVTITCSSCTINGASTLTIPQYNAAYFTNDGGTNWYAFVSAVGLSGSGTVTTFSCVTANGVSCSVANASTTPAATFVLGAITPTSVAASGGAITDAPSALAISGAAVATNAALSNYFYVTLTHTASTTISNPSNPTDSQIITYELTQDSTGGNAITWGTAFDGCASGIPSPSTAANKVDIYGWRYSGRLSKWLLLNSTGLGC
jgi:hypothetical protein